MRRAIILLLSATIAGALAPSVRADIPVYDDDVEDKRAEDEEHSKKDTETQAEQLEGQEITNCNISQKEKKRRLYRSPAQAVKEDAKNVELSSTMRKSTMSPSASHCRSPMPSPGFRRALARPPASRASCS